MTNCLCWGQFLFHHFPVILWNAFQISTYGTNYNQFIWINKKENAFEAAVRIKWIFHFHWPRLYLSLNQGVLFAGICVGDPCNFLLRHYVHCGRCTCWSVQSIEQAQVSSVAFGCMLFSEFLSEILFSCWFSYCWVKFYVTLLFNLSYNVNCLDRTSSIKLMHCVHHVKLDLSHFLHCFCG